jgi:hypothetical protein
VNFAKRQKSVAITAIFNESGLKRRLYPRDFGKINITAQLFSIRRLEIKFFDAVTSDDDDPGFFGMRRIYKHFVGHCSLSMAPALNQSEPMQASLRLPATLSQAFQRSNGGKQKMAKRRPVDAVNGRRVDTLIEGNVPDKTRKTHATA